jgi:hypothetical protein
MNFKKRSTLSTKSKITKHTKKEEKEVSSIKFLPNPEILLMINHLEIRQIKA